MPQVRPIWLRAPDSKDHERVGSGALAPVVAGPQGPAMVTVRRTSNDDVRDRQVYLSFDGEEWATIYYGDAVTREVAPGRHVIKANNTLVRRSVEFEVR